MTLACAGVVGFVYYGFTSCVDRMTAPVETVSATFPCGDRTLEVLERQRTINWLEGASHTDVLLRVSGEPPAELPISWDEFPAWIPTRRLPPHRIDGDPEGTAFAVYLDPAALPSAAADAVEGCLAGRREEVVAAVLDTESYRYTDADAEGVEPAVIYWRGAPADLRPTFTAPGGHSLWLQPDGSFWYESAGGGSLSGRAERREDGTLHVAVELRRWDGRPTPPLSAFRTEAGQSLEAWFGVPIDPRFDRR